MPKKLNNRYRILEVVWVDSATYTGWRSADEWLRIHEDKQLCTTVGFVVEETDSILLLNHSLSWDKGGDIAQRNGLISIPLVSVMKRRILGYIESPIKD